MQSWKSCKLELLLGVHSENMCQNLFESLMPLVKFIPRRYESSILRYVIKLFKIGFLISEKSGTNNFGLIK